MPYHWSKKVLFLPYLSFETKKSFLVGGWRVKSDFSVSLCSSSILNFWTHRQRNGHRAWQYFYHFRGGIRPQRDKNYFSFFKPSLKPQLSDTEQLKKSVPWFACLSLKIYLMIFLQKSFRSSKSHITSCIIRIPVYSSGNTRKRLVQYLKVKGNR